MNKDGIDQAVRLLNDIINDMDAATYGNVDESEKIDIMYDVMNSAKSLMRDLSRLHQYAE